MQVVWNMSIQRMILMILKNKDDLLKVIYNYGPVNDPWDDFQTVRDRVQREWHAAPKIHNPISSPMQDKINQWIKDHPLK